MAEIGLTIKRINCLIEFQREGQTIIKFLTASTYRLRQSYVKVL